MGSLGVESRYVPKLLHVALDERALTDPSSAWASVPYDDDDLSKGYEEITFAVLANAVNKLAWYINSVVGPANDFETIAYIGQADMRYQIMAIAVQKTQHKALFSSHLHSATAHLSLMERTDARFLLTASGVMVDDILAGRDMPHFVIPELEELLAPTPTKPFPYDKTYEEAAQDPYLILHSSGTTGLPKPIVVNHAANTALARRGELPKFDPRTKQYRRVCEVSEPSRFLVPFLPFHGICSLLIPVSVIFGDAVYIPGLRKRMTTLHDIRNVLKHCKADITMLSPAMVEEIVRAPDAAECLSSVKELLYGGAPLHHAAAELASKHARLSSQWGQTELMKCIDFACDPEDYDYCAYDLVTSGMRMESVAGVDNVFQMHFDRTPEAYPYMPLWHRCPELHTFDTGDLWEPHPDPAKAPFTFRFYGRADDLITYADGENVSCPVYASASTPRVDLSYSFSCPPHLHISHPHHFS
jgi:acyl-coenzyme A synthetase/AMP-(fatty) acid ligase